MSTGRTHHLMPTNLDGPSPDDLAAIETEEPLITAEMAWLAAEITLINADERGGPSPLDWQRLRRTEARVIREALAYVACRTSAVPRRAA